MPRSPKRRGNTRRAPSHVHDEVCFPTSPSLRRYFVGKQRQELQIQESSSRKYSWQFLLYIEARVVKSFMLLGVFQLPPHKNRSFSFRSLNISGERTDCYYPPPKCSEQSHWLAGAKIFQEPFAQSKFDVFGVYGAVSIAGKGSNVVSGEASFDTAGYSLTSLLCGAPRLNGWGVPGCMDPVCGPDQLWAVFSASHFSQATDERC